MTKFKTSNFREIKAGKIFLKTLYRSNHPIFNKRQVKDLVLSANEAKIQTIINLSDSAAALKPGLLHCPWYKKLYNSKNVVTLDISMNFDITDALFLKKIKRGIKFMLKRTPPYLIHCQVGIDRTGFFAILLESFMEASLSEMAKDYMLSYVAPDEYSKTDDELGSEFVLNIISKICGRTLSSSDDIYNAAYKYLKDKVKLKNHELLELKNILSGKY